MKDRLAAILHSALAWLRSYRGSVIILSALCLLLAVWVVPFQLAGQSKATVDAIVWGWLPLQVAYALTGTATLYCTYVRFTRDVRRARRGPRAEAVPSSHAVVLDRADDLATVASALSVRGFEVTAEEERLVAVKNRWSTLGGSAFHLAIVLFALAVYLQYATAQTAQVRVIEGQSFGEAAAASESWVSRAVEGLILKTIQPEYFRDVLLFTRLDATLLDATGAPMASSLSRPLWLDTFTHLSVQDYGLAPSFTVTDGVGKVLDDSTVALALNPPGARDSVTLPGSGLDLSVVAFPDYSVIDGRDASISYNLQNPRLRLSASRSEPATRTARALLAVGDSMKVGDYTVRLTGIARHGTFSVFRTHSTIPIAIASFLMLAGLVVRLFMPRHDVVVWDWDGVLLADAWLDSFGRSEGLRRLRAALPAGGTR